MTTDFKEVRRRYRVIAILAVWRWLIVILIAVIGIAVAAFSPSQNPIDNQATRSRELVRQILVADDKRNGFAVWYITRDRVTKDRLTEIRRRSSVRDSLENLKRAAPLKFGNMVHTDIYDFADFAVQFDPPDIQIYNIFVSGPDKEKLYIGENPRIRNWAKWIHPGTQQGLLFLRSEDIYCNHAGHGKVYRYFECRGVNQISDNDEHFSHFSEDERIY